MKTKHLFYTFLFVIFIALVYGLFTYQKTKVYYFKDDFTFSFGPYDHTTTKILKLNYFLVNKYVASLKVMDIKDGCNCMNSRVKATEYKMGDTIFIETLYDHQKYNDTGEVNRNVFLITDQAMLHEDSILTLYLHLKFE